MLIMAAWYVMHYTCLKRLLIVQVLGELKSPKVCLYVISQWDDY